MTETFFTLLENLTNGIPDRYPPSEFEIDTNFTHTERSLICDMDAALILITTEIYGLRSAILTSHEKWGAHRITFQQGYYNKSEYAPRMENFLAACRQARSRENLVLNIKEHKNGTYSIEPDNYEDIFHLICALFERAEFEKAVLEGKSTVPVNTFLTLFDNLSTTYSALPKQSHADASFPSPVPQPQYH